MNDFFDEKAGEVFRHIATKVWKDLTESASISRLREDLEVILAG